MARTSKRETVFQPEFLQDLAWWIKSNRSGALRVLALVESTLRDPFLGAGKPEPLKYQLAGSWSRRITLEHRLIYRVSDKRIDFMAARYHY